MPTTPPPAPAVLELLAGLDQLSEKFAPENNDLRRWLAERTTDPAVREQLQYATPLALMVLRSIGKHQPVNGATISKDLNTPKGSVSKIARRLVADGLIVTEALPNNKKEVLFRLTALGRAVDTLHTEFDAQMQRGLFKFLERYHPDEVLFMVRLLNDLLASDFLALGNVKPKRG